MPTPRYLQALGFAPQNRRFGAPLSGAAHYRGYDCNVIQEVIAGESAPLASFPRFTVFLKAPNELCLSLDPRRSLPVARSAAAVRLAAERALTDTIAIVQQALPMNAWALYLLELSSDRVCGYSDWQGTDVEVYSRCLETLIELARRIDWIHTARHAGAPKRRIAEARGGSAGSA